MGPNRVFFGGGLDALNFFPWGSKNTETSDEHGEIVLLQE